MWVKCELKCFGCEWEQEWSSRTQVVASFARIPSNNPTCCTENVIRRKKTARRKNVWFKGLSMNVCLTCDHLWGTPMFLLHEREKLLDPRATRMQGFLVLSLGCRCEGSSRLKIHLWQNINYRNYVISISKMYMYCTPLERGFQYQYIHDMYVHTYDYLIYTRRLSRGDIST